MKQTNKEIEINEAVNQFLPNVTVKPLRSGNQNKVHHVHYYISTQNKDLAGSEYFYNGNLNFIHFTNLYALQSIISDRNLRLYNLHNLNDPREYSFAGNLQSFNVENKQDAKDNFYLFSMCHEDILSSRLTTDIEFNMWRLYGNNGNGVAIELNFDRSHPINWKDYYLGNVHYGAASKTNLKELNKLLRKFESNEPIVSVDLGQIVCFHKSKLFKLEQEIRLLFDNRKVQVEGSTTYSYNDLVTSPIITTDIAKSSFADNEINYLDLPIHHTEFEPVFDKSSIPVPKIERIVLGFQFKDNFKKVANQLNDLCEKRLGYNPKIEKSRLTKWYHDSQ